jgi:two-component system cell cycle sensor histidine kinase/response regulator CckA
MNGRNSFPMSAACPLCVIRRGGLPLWLPSRLCLVALTLLALAVGRAQILATEPSLVITDAGMFWTLDEFEKQKPHTIRMEFTVCYYDPIWNLLWGAGAGGNFYLTCQAGAPLPLKSGQRVRLEGTVVPAKGLSGRELKVTVLAENAWPVPHNLNENFEDPVALNAGWVTAEGYVFRQLESDASHMQYYALIGGQRTSVRLLVGDSDPIPELLNLRVRFHAVCVSARDPAGRLLRIDLWVPSSQSIEFLGRLEDDPHFKLPRTPVDRLSAVPAGQWVRIVGKVHSQEPGRALTVRDDTGQLEVQTAQPDLVLAGEEIEVVGRADGSALAPTLREPLYRPASSSIEKRTAPTELEPPRRLRLAGQVLALRPEEAAQGQPVSLRGVVTWSDPRAQFFYLQDASGGVRVRRTSLHDAVPSAGSVLTLSGKTAQGEFSPELMLETQGDSLPQALPLARSVTLEQVLSGAEEARRVEMHGYLRAVTREGEWLRLDFTTDTGEFTALTAPAAGFADLVGAVVRVAGVCSAQANAQRQLTGITLWVTDREDLEVEEPRPADPFAVPERSIVSLRQFSAASTGNRRVRVSGTVLAQEPGRFFYLQEGEAAVLVLTRSAEHLAPGVRVEVVGLPGREGSRTVLREAVFRPVAGGARPVPLVLAEPVQLVPDADARLVRLRGTLLEQIAQRAGAQLTLQAGGMIFDAWGPDPKVAERFQRGSRLELTGVYRLEFDEYRRPRGFTVLLRSADDVHLLTAPPWWTAGRVAAVAAAFALCTALGIVWVVALRRRVARQTEQIRAQLANEVRLQAELERSSRLESLGVLAGGIAHDFNNLLTAIMGNLSLVTFEDRAMELVGQQVRDAQRAAKRAGDVTQQLLTFAKGGDPVRQAVRLAEVVQEAVTFALHGSKVRSEISSPPDLPAADVDAGQISRVVHNLVLNAVQAMPDGGVVRLSLKAVDMAADEIAGLAPGRYVQLIVADNGPGIAAEHLARIFEPYFSTKGRGNGLGLATVHSIIRKHQGHIAVESHPGQGTTFRLWLHAARTAPSAERAGQSQVPLTRPARVLVMDDEDVIRAVAGRMLAMAGHQAVFAADGTEAVQAYRAARDAGQPFDLAIFDLTVPGGKGGKDALQEILQFDPQVRAVASSGYSNDPVMASPAAYGFRSYLRKPYELRDLLRAIDEVRED